MKMCEAHWSKLRDAISERKLDHLIAPDGMAAAEMMKRQLEGNDSALDFDPLMNAHNQLVSVSMDFVGAMQVMTGEQCPVCLLEQYNWCSGAADQSRLYAEKNGLMLPDGGAESKA